MRAPALLLVAILLTILPSHATQVAHGSTELIVNGGFENRNASGWTVLGNVRTVTIAHSDTYSLRLGSRNGPAQISQSFNLPRNVAASLSFWYMGVPGDYGTTALVATLLDQNGAVVGQWDGWIDYKWHHVTFGIAAGYSNSTMTLRFIGEIDFLHGLSDLYCPPPPLPCRHRVIVYPVFVYVDDISVTYS